MKFFPAARISMSREAELDLAVLGLVCKRPDLWSENEWRIQIIQRDGQGQFTPFKNDRGDCCFNLPLVVPDVVTEILCGPLCEISRDVLETQLKDAGLDPAEIRWASCGCEDDPILLTTGTS
jgi:hypothetical protein